MNSYLILAVVCTIRAASADEVVTYGSVVKLLNTQEGSRLHSHEVKYGSGSGQQSVTAVQGSDDVNSHWAIMPTKEKPEARGEPIKCGGQIRLKHLQTGCFLHSHHFPGPLSKNSQEVSCFGSESESDTGDNWEVRCDADEWLDGESVRLRHVDTDVFLALSGQQFGRPIAGQREVVGQPESNYRMDWQTAEGVFMGRNKLD